MKFRISAEFADDGQDHIFEDEDELFDYCISEDFHDDDESFEEWVNDNEGYIAICGESYYAYDILRELNYHVLDDLKESYCTEQNDNDMENARWEIRHTTDRYITIQAYNVEIIREEEQVDKVSIEQAIKELRDSLKNRHEEEETHNDFMQILGA